MVVPVHHVREAGGDRGHGLDVVRPQRRALRVSGFGYGVQGDLLLHLPRQDARPVRPLRRALRRLLHPLLVRAMRAHPGVQGARRARLRPQAWVAPQHGAPRRRRRRRARRATHGTLASLESSIDHLSCIYMCICRIRPAL